MGEAADPRPGVAQVLDVRRAGEERAYISRISLAGTGQVVVRDLTENKILLVEDNIRRTGFTNIRAEVWDALEEDPSWEEQADIVIRTFRAPALGIGKSRTSSTR